MGLSTFSFPILNLHTLLSYGSLLLFLFLHVDCRGVYVDTYDRKPIYRYNYIYIRFWSQNLVKGHFKLADEKKTPPFYPPNNSQMSTLSLEGLDYFFWGGGREGIIFCTYHIYIILT